MLSDDKKAILESAMDKQIAILEKDLDHWFDSPFTCNQFNISRVVNIWKMLREDPTAWDGSPRMRASDTSPWIPDTEENRRKLGFSTPETANR